MQYKIKDELTISDFLKLREVQGLYDLNNESDFERNREYTKFYKHIISWLCGLDLDEIDNMTAPVFAALRGEVAKIIEKDIYQHQGGFFPTFEVDGVVYGFEPLSSMSVENYTDLEYAIQTKDELLMLAVCYRPISNETDSVTNESINGEEVANNVYTKNYELVPYNGVDVMETKKAVKEAPASVMLGFVSFFTILGAISSVDSESSLKEVAEILQVEAQSL